ncbi:MAG: hypothetical protein HYX63_01515 [Gammaproteobacteria bacterium]|nr:hypothetical protein [Gammaproteobacteria bacterium]
MTKGNPNAQIKDTDKGRQAYALDREIARYQGYLRRLEAASPSWDKATKERGDNTRARILADIQKLQDERFAL